MRLSSLLLLKLGSKKRSKLKLLMKVVIAEIFSDHYNILFVFILHELKLSTSACFPSSDSKKRAAYNCNISSPLSPISIY